YQPPVEEKKADRPVSSSYQQRFNYISVENEDAHNGYYLDKNGPSAASTYRPSEYQKYSQPQTPLNNDENSIAGYAKNAGASHGGSTYQTFEEKEGAKTPTRYFYQMGEKATAPTQQPAPS
ncbi:MAG: hypothetical protein ACK55I_39470, partial [bacterium]